VKQSVKQRLTLKFQLVFFLLLLVQVSCIKKTTVVPQSQRLLPAKTATRPELLQGLLGKSGQIDTLKATVALDLSRGGAKTGVLDEYRQTKGYVIVERPAHIRVQVQMPLVLTTVAVMVSDGEQYRVSIPIKNQFAIQDVNAPIDPQNSLSSLRPQIFLEGLFVDVRPYVDKPNMSSFMEEAVVGIHSYYVFSFFKTESSDTQLLEKIWIDRSDLQVARKQLFGKDGRLETDVDYQDYPRVDAKVNGAQFPKTIVIRRPNEDITVKVTFQQAQLNETVDQKTFDLPRPQGSELVQLKK
jgi:outer membrane lipoprotein-sorting protein